jgi:hypothetical protein
VTLADERARQQGTQTSTYTGAPVLDPTTGRELRLVEGQCDDPRADVIGDAAHPYLVRQIDPIHDATQPNVCEDQCNVLSTDQHDG